MSDKKIIWRYVMMVMALCLTLGLTHTHPAYADDDDDDDDGEVSQVYVANEVVVKLDPAAGATINDINDTYGTTTLETLLGSANIYLLQTPSGQDAGDVADSMESDTRLRYVEPNYFGRAPEADGRSRGAWGGQDSQPFGDQYGVSMLGLACAHTLSRGQGSVVAVLDTGVQLDHPDLAGRLTAARYDFIDDDPLPEDQAGGDLTGHGTHVAGVVRLVAPQSQIMPLRVLDPLGQGNEFVIAEAVLYAAQNGADVINLSLGMGQMSELLEDIIEEVTTTYGVVVVAAAGNLNSPLRQYPAAEESVLAVTSIGPERQKSQFSNFGDWIDVAAPGESIYSTFPINGYAWWSGTSMATPFIAGQAALVDSVNASLTPEMVNALIKGTAQSVDASNAEYAGQLGAGLPDFVASLEQASGNQAGCQQNGDTGDQQDQNNEDVAEADEDEEEDQEEDDEAED